MKKYFERKRIEKIVKKQLRLNPNMSIGKIVGFVLSLIIFSVLIEFIPIGFTNESIYFDYEPVINIAWLFE
jgi:hypothetical protein